MFVFFSFWGEFEKEFKYLKTSDTAYASHQHNKISYLSSGGRGIQNCRVEAENLDLQLPRHILPQ